jgi:hypothetical protein
MTNASAVIVIIRRRAQRYSLGGRRHQPQAKNAAVAGKCTPT